MELRHLRYFVVAAEDENFRAASERLNVAQSALSRRIRDLEAELQVRLFDRDRQRIRLSPAGRAYYEDVKRILRNLEEAGHRGRNISRGELGTLRLGFYETVVRHRVIVEAFREFRSRHSKVTLQLDPVRPSNAVEALQRNDIDATFVYDRPLDEKTFDHMEIVTDQFVLALRHDHPLAGQPSLRLRDLADEDFVWLRREVAPLLHDRLITTCHAAGLTPHIVQEAVNESTRLHLVAAGMGVSFMVSSSESHWPEGVVAQVVTDLTVPLQLDFIWLRDRCSLVLERFLEVLAEVRDSQGQAPDRALA